MWIVSSTFHVYWKGTFKFRVEQNQYNFHLTWNDLNNNSTTVYWYLTIQFIVLCENSCFFFLVLRSTLKRSDLFWRYFLLWTFTSLVIWHLYIFEVNLPKREHELLSNDLASVRPILPDQSHTLNWVVTLETNEGCVFWLSRSTVSPPPPPLPA